MSSLVTYILTSPVQPPKQIPLCVSSKRKRNTLEQKRVGFEEDDIIPKIYSMLHLLMKAIRMAEKHEANPSTTTQRRKYRKTIDLRSASGWTKWNLDVFNANFERDQYTDLRRYLGEDAYQMNSQFAEGKVVNI